MHVGHIYYVRVLVCVMRRMQPFLAAKRRGILTQRRTSTLAHEKARFQGLAAEGYNGGLQRRIMKEDQCHEHSAVRKAIDGFDQLSVWDCAVAAKRTRNNGPNGH
jgi:hypothetical protein